MKIELKPCPFCGGEAYLKYSDIAMVAEWVGVRCKKCNAGGGKKDASVEYCAVEKAAEFWNRRVDNG